MANDQYILAHFTSGGTPAIGLSPTIRIRDISTGSLVITDATMSGVGDGGYSYDFTSYDSQEDYSIRCDGGATLSGSERYTFGGNENYVNDVVDGVWDETLADHTQAGTYGGELATKADIAASTSTDSTTAISGSVIFGTEDSGTYISTNIRDDNYWVIEADVIAGLTVELVFNIPDDNRAGVFRVFGRYEGNPPSTHYQNLWVYNYEALAWERLIEEFMPGGNTSDSEYTHEYFERNIDRNNNNEVKFRTVHNVTSYNDSHHMFIDFAEVTSINIITAADIANAVWTEDITSITTFGTAGKILNDLEIYAIRALGLMQENYYLDNNTYTTYNDVKLLTGGRIRVYSNASSVGTASDVIGTYVIEADWTNDELNYYKVAKQ